MLDVKMHFVKSIELFSGFGFISFVSNAHCLLRMRMRAKRNQ